MHTSLAINWRNWLFSMIDQEKTMAGENQAYWNYRYLFECCDKIKIVIVDTKKYSYIIKILGVNQRALTKSIDDIKDSQCYIAKIDSCDENNNDNIFSKGDRVYCRYLDGFETKFGIYHGALIYKDAGTEYKCKFSVTTSIATINRSDTDNMKIHSRYKDLTFNKQF